MCREFKPIIRSAYYDSTDPQLRNKFSLELTKPESKSLCQAFDRKAGTSGNRRPQPMPGSAAAPAPQPQR